MKLGQNVCLDDILHKFENGSKTRSQGQILEKPCVHYTGHIFRPIIMKLGQDDCLDEILHEFENGSCWVKNQVIRSNVRKTLCMLERPHFQSDNHEIWSEWSS